MPWVLRKIFSLEMVKNYICLRRASKQNAPFSENFPQKNAPMLLMSRIGSEIWRKLKNLMKNDIPNIPDYCHISNPNLLKYEFDHIVINFITRFPWRFEINHCQLLLEEFFCGKQKMHVSEYVCKNWLKELEILLKCRKMFEKVLAACNSFKITGLPQFFFKEFWQLYFKNINFLTKTKRFLHAEFYEFKTI